MRLAPPSARSRCPVRGGIGPGVMTLAWLRAAGRAGCGRRALPAGSPGAPLMLAGGGLRPGRRVLLACRNRVIMSNRTPLNCGVLGNEQCGLADVPGDHEQLTRHSWMRGQLSATFAVRCSGEGCVRRGRCIKGVGAPRLAFVTEPGPAAEEDDESPSGVPARQTGLCRLPFSHRRQSSHMTEAKAPPWWSIPPSSSRTCSCLRAHGCKRGCGR